MDILAYQKKNETDREKKVLKCVCMKIGVQKFEN